MTGEAGGSRNTGTIPIKLESGTRILEERLYNTGTQTSKLRDQDRATRPESVKTRPLPVEKGSRSLTRIGSRGKTVCSASAYSRTELDNKICKSLRNAKLKLLVSLMILIYSRTTFKTKLK